MKTFKNIDAKLYEPEGLKQDFRKTVKGKGNNAQVKSVMQNLDKHTEILSEKLRNNSFTNANHQCMKINESSCKKTRNIQKPIFLYEQPAHHSIIRAAMPVFMTGMYDLSCASIPGRGPHYAKRFILRWINKDPANCKYILKFDIYHFFENIPHRRLKKALKKKIRDKEFLRKMFSIIDSCEKGLPIGYYTSQWFANFYLTPLDHYIKERIHIKYMVRYMDDVVCFGRNKKELHRAQREIEKYLKEELGLKMKSNWQVFRFEYIDKNGKRRGRMLDFLGFQFHRTHTGIRKSILNRTMRKVNKIKKKGKVTWKDAASIMSRMGYIKHTDTYGYYTKYIKPTVKIKTLKQLVRKHTRKEREKKWSG